MPLAFWLQRARRRHAVVTPSGRHLLTFPSRRSAERWLKRADLNAGRLNRAGYRVVPWNEESA